MDTGLLLLFFCCPHVHRKDQTCTWCDNRVPLEDGSLEPPELDGLVSYVWNVKVPSRTSLCKELESGRFSKSWFPGITYSTHNCLSSLGIMSTSGAVCKVCNTCTVRGTRGIKGGRRERRKVECWSLGSMESGLRDSAQSWWVTGLTWIQSPADLTWGRRDACG